MADKDQLKGSSAGLDPFAELATIMGFDPRERVETAEAKAKKAAEAASSDAPNAEQASPEPQAAEQVVGYDHALAEDDFSLDLERELLADDYEDHAVHDLEVVNSVAIEVAVDPADEAEPLPPVETLASADNVVESALPVYADDHFELDLDQIEDEIDQEVADFVVAGAGQSADVADAPVDITSVAVASTDLEDEPVEDALFADGDTDALMDDAFSPEPEPVVEEEPVIPLRGAGRSYLADVDLNFDSEMDEVNWDNLKPEPAVLAAPAAAIAASSAATEDNELEAEFDALLGNDRIDDKRSALGASEVDEEIDVAFDEANHPADVDFDDTTGSIAAEPAPVPLSGVSEPMAASAKDDPFAELMAMANSMKEYPVSGTTVPRTFQRANPVAHTPAPELETIAFDDAASVLAEDLDLPEISYEEPHHPVTNDLDLEFETLLEQMNNPAPVHRDMAAAARSHEVSRAQPVHEYAQPAARAPSERYYSEDELRANAKEDADFQRAYNKTMDALESNDTFLDEDFGDDDYEPMAAHPAMLQEQRKPRRGLMLAAIVGGLALLGGIGAVAMSFGGSGDGAPALVRADAKPVKVRPENPGGTVVPNQNATVYDAVSKDGAPKTTQERLVSDTEEPIELPQPQDDDIEQVDSVAKAEDRVTPSEAEGEQQNIAVAPRKVRTMVVRPDGTLAPAEPAAAPAEPEAETVEGLSAEDSEPEQITTGATQPTAEPQEPVAVSGWAVQVSSQPNEAAANKSLGDIKRRYSSVISDRGVGIVKGEVAGKGTFWRVRVAANSREDAVALCGDLKSAGGSCFVTK